MIMHYFQKYETIIKTIVVSLFLIIFFDIGDHPVFASLNNIMLANEFLGFTWNDLFSSAVYICFFSLFIIRILGEKINPLFKHISEHRLPKEMKDAVISKIDDFVPSGYDVSDLLKMISINETIYHFSQQTYSSERIFSLYIYIYIYILNDGRPVVSDFVTKTYFIISFNSPFRFGGGGISYYSLTTISAGYLETFYSKRRLTICLNDQVLGYFDYTNRVLCDSMELQTVFFKKPRVLL